MYTKSMYVDDHMNGSMYVVWSLFIRQDVYCKKNVQDNAV
jgi:hypothetical protein